MRFQKCDQSERQVDRGIGAGRDNCSACGHAIDMPLLDVFDAPAILGCTSRPSAIDTFTDFSVFVCRKCGLIQTDARFDLEAYSEAHSLAVGRLWDDHHQMFLAFISEQIAMAGVSVTDILEVGPSAKPIARMLSVGTNNTQIQYADFIRDTPFILADNEAYSNRGFPASGLDAEFDLIIASHVIEHVSDVASFLRGVVDHLRGTGLAVFSLPNFEAWFKRGYWNALTSEHVSYLVAGQIAEAAARVGLASSFAYFKEHSLFFALRRGEGDKIPHSQAPEVSQALLLSWADQFHHYLQGYDAVKVDEGDLVLAGASHLAQYLWLMSARIATYAQFVIDNDTGKHGKRLYGTPLVAAPFNSILALKQPVVLIPPSPYSAEMERQVKSLRRDVRVFPNNAAGGGSEHRDSMGRNLAV